MHSRNFELDCSDLIYLSNTLNEVLNGFEIQDWNQQRFASRKEVILLLSRLHSTIESVVSNKALVELSEDETQLVIWASDICATQLDPAEFQTRLGSSLSYGRALSTLLAKSA